MLYLTCEGSHEASMFRGAADHGMSGVHNFLVAPRDLYLVTDRGSTHRVEPKSVLGMSSSPDRRPEMQALVANSISQPVIENKLTRSPVRLLRRRGPHVRAMNACKARCGS